MSLVRKVVYGGAMALAVIAQTWARADEALLRDPEALKTKVTEIVTPHLHRNDAGNGQTDKQPANRAWAIVVGIVTPDDRHVYGFGRFSAKSDQQPDGRTLFEIGSVTKTFTALLLADLVERGEMKLDDPVRMYLPESVEVPRHGDKEITLLHLATHTSALPRIPISIGLVSLVSDNPYDGYGTEDLYQTLASTKLRRDPGEKYAYSNLAFGLLGHVLSRHADKSYEALVVERICNPLALHQTRISLDADAQQRLAPPHDALGKPSSNWDFDAIAGAGALRSTTDDMLSYLKAQMGWKKSALLPAMRNSHQVRFPAGNKVQSICLGWHTDQVPGRPSLIFHGGGTGGYSSLVGFVHEDGKPLYGLVVFANSAPGVGGMAANDIAIKLLKAIHASGEAQVIRTIAGTGHGADGGDGGPALSTSLVQPFDVEIGPDGALYICEFGAHRIRKLDLKTKQITNVAGTSHAGYSGDGGPALAATLNQPHELQFDREGNLYFTDMRNHAIRRIAAANGVISTLAGSGKLGYAGDGGPAQEALLNQPHSVCFDGQTGLYIADTGNHRVRHIDIKSGRIETVAGTGERKLPADGGAAGREPLFGPRAICLVNGELWIALREGHSVWRLDLKTGKLHHVAGSGKAGYQIDRGPAKDALVNSPKGISQGPDGRVYLVDSSNHCLRAIDPKTLTIETIAGRGGQKGFAGEGEAVSKSLLNNPHGVGFGPAGEIFVGDSDNHRVRAIVSQE